MNGSKIFFFIIILLAGGWHFAESSSSRKITGLFQFVPRQGYVWTDTWDKHSKYFWEDSGTASWMPGRRVKEYHAHMSDVEDRWETDPGYVWVDEKTRTARWQSGLLHPTLKAYSGEKEGNWFAIFGYEFEKSNDLSYITVWVPGLKDDRLKLISDQAEGTYNAYPGYVFISPGSLSVKWQSGLTHSENPYYVSGVTEGTWIEKDQWAFNQGSSDQTSSNGSSSEELTHGQKWLLSGIAGGTIEAIFGKNFVSDAFKKTSDKEFADMLFGK